MTAPELLIQLEQLGARLTVDGERLKIDAPAGAVAHDLRAELSAHKAEILALLRGRLPVNQEVDLRDDPRPDLAEDSATWAAALAEAAKVDYEDPRGVFGALYGVRCLGARLAAAAGGWHLVRPAGFGRWPWEDLSEEWLRPHMEALRRVLECRSR